MSNLEDTINAIRELAKNFGDPTMGVIVTFPAPATQEARSVPTGSPAEPQQEEPIITTAREIFEDGQPLPIISYGLVPLCPQCGGPMHDNRKDKLIDGSKGPWFRCQQRGGRKCERQAKDGRSFPTALFENQYKSWMEKYTAWVDNLHRYLPRKGVSMREMQLDVGASETLYGAFPPEVRESLGLEGE